MHGKKVASGEWRVARKTVISGEWRVASERQRAIGRERDDFEEGLKARGNSGTALLTGAQRTASG
jgi:hypothetical protein